MKIRPIIDKEKEEITTVDLSYLRAVKKQLEKRLEDTVFPNAAVLNLTPDTDADMKKKVEDAEKFETKIGAQLEEVSSCVERFEIADPVLTTAATSNPTIGSLKMPNFELPKFSGQYKDWTPFREHFVASVHANKTIAPKVQLS